MLSFLINKIPENILNTLQLLKIPISPKKGTYIFFGFISLAWISAFFSGYHIDSEKFYWGQVVHETGELAWKLLMFTVFISLLCKVFPKMQLFAQLLPFRKLTGIFSFLIALSHGLAAFLDWGWGAYSLSETLPFLTEDIGMIFGAVAFFAMLPAFITSTFWAMKTMGFFFWKNIQRLTHVAFVFTVLHLMFLRYHYTSEIEYEAIVPFLIYVIGYAYVFWKRRKSEA